MGSESASLHGGALRGTVARVLFENRDSGWAVVHMELAEAGLATVVGPLAPVFPGESLEIQGRWEDDPRYGRQFRARSATPVQPQDEEGIRRYLASGVLPGVGPELARRIVGTFGADTLQVLDEDTERLLEVTGIGEGRLADIREAWQARSAERQARIFLQGHGLGPTLTDRILREWGEDALARVRRDPYELIPEIRGIGFRTADGLALEMGWAREAEERVLAGVDHVLREAANGGDCFLPRSRLVRAAARLLEIDDDDVVEQVVDVAGRAGDLMLERIPAEEAAGGDQGVWLPGLYHAEARVARRLTRLAARGRPAGVEGTTDNLIRQVEVDMGIGLGDEQRRAVARALEEPLLVVTGGPGTGKTTLVDALVRCSRQLGEDVLLAAPTGRAAKRLEVATGHPAATIHRTLEYRYEQGFTRGPENPLEADLLVVDEVSMVDLPLMDALVGALPPEGRLLLVGDADQLPSVGPGAVLRDILDSGAVPTERLREIYRQAARSAIVRNAHRVNAGRLPRGQGEPEPDGGDGARDFYVIDEGEPDRAMDLVLRLVTSRIPGRFGLDPMRDIQVLAPMHRGRCGVARLNLALQRALNPVSREGDEDEEPTLRPGDRVMQLRNDYDREVFNGDIGRVVAVEDGGLTVDFEGRAVGYERRDAGDLTLAYAVSIHKSQGSEYPAVVALLLPEHRIMLQRNLLYTALTRARQLAVLIGTGSTLRQAVENAAPSRRETLLASRLRAAAASAAGNTGGATAWPPSGATEGS